MFSFTGITMLTIYLVYLKERSLSLRGWIDYQDALVGPCVYDIVSLTRDARVDVDKEIEDNLIDFYLRKFSFIDKNLFYYLIK